MKILPLLIFSLFIFSAANAQEYNAALREELLAMRKVDQQERENCVKGTAEEQFRCLGEKVAPIDAKHTKRLEEIFSRYGFPSAKLVGQDGVEAFLLILQHAPNYDLRLKCEKPIKKAFARKEISANEYSNFIDRLRVHLGKPQIYGSNFESKGEKLVMSKTRDLKNLDKRRAKIGLPPIAEYVKMLREFYKLEVELPEI